MKTFREYLAEAKAEKEIEINETEQLVLNEFKDPIYEDLRYIIEQSVELEKNLKKNDKKKMTDNAKRMLYYLKICVPYMEEYIKK